MTSPYHLEPEALPDTDTDTDTDTIVVANEFAEIRVRRAPSRNGDRLLIESPRTGGRVVLCPLELQALTWQGTATFTAMLAKPWEPLIDEQL